MTIYLTPAIPDFPDFSRHLSTLKQTLSATLMRGLKGTSYVRDLITEMLENTAELSVAAGLELEEFAQAAVKAYCECMRLEVVDCTIEIEVEELPPSN